MDARRRMVSQILESGLSVSEAARLAGVSRQTAHVWVGRARQDGLAQMNERSKRPLRSPRETDKDLVAQVLAVAEERPYWGSSILHPFMWPSGEAPITERTVARILARAGRRVSPASVKAEPIRFERTNPNDLWQADFKKMGPRRKKSDSLSVLDDAVRYCLDLRVVPNQTLDSVWSVLWPLFEEFGLPLEMLTDNGSAFRNNATWRWSSFDLKIMLLDIKPAHGKPYHPQTQGKVERLHGTIEREIDFTRQCDVQAELDTFRDRYNWLRPHQALHKRTPGSVYTPSPRKRPQAMPEPFFPEGAFIRKCQDPGVVSYKGAKYKVGRSFTGLPIGILADSKGQLNFVWGNFILGPISEHKL